ncbi:MAG: hypothetical protein JSV51_05675 [Candidatus Bathyarchaeota archaeon]|nr:MAG: hypothetical protein JSV51_05675 [Candidatus Bathyarchaeota archaeon]
MIQSCDVGSLPYPDNLSGLLKGTRHFTSGLSNKHKMVFEDVIVNTFIDKLKAGIMVPAFPQFRDMNQMFLSTFEGMKRIDEGYIETGCLTLKQKHEKILEVAIIERNVERIHAEIGNSFQLKVCITGPYTLASFFPYRNSQTFNQLGQVLSEILEKTIFSVKQCKISMISIDEPLFGLVDDSLIDKGAEGREALLLAWESITSRARSRKIETCMHLHNTSDDLFWKVKSLRVLESHINDPIYEMKATRQRLDEEDKYLKASIAISDFDHLIRRKLGSDTPDEAIAKAWKDILKGIGTPEVFFENIEVLKKRLMRVIEHFGIERVKLAGPECGLRGFPTYALAIEYLRHVSKAVELTTKMYA